MVNNDLISRSALIAEHCDGCDALANGLCDHDVCGAAQLIMEAPAVDAVVLPVKPGSVVWILNHKFSAEIEEVCIREDGVFAVWVEYDRSPELTEVWDNGEFDIKEIGKTVFLTVEELEKAETEG